MKSWVSAFRIDPPVGVVSARNGGSVFFAAFSRVLRQWYMLVPGGEEKIDEPQMIFVEREYVEAHKRDISRVPRRPTIKLREGKLVQFELAI